MKTQKLNYPAIAVLVVIQMALAGLWYEVLVKDIWLHLSGVTLGDLENFSPVNFLWPFLAALTLAYIMATLLRALQVTTLARALQVAFIWWLCFLFFEMAALNVMSYRKLELTLVDQGITLIKYLVNAAVLTLWKR